MATNSTRVPGRERRKPKRGSQGKEERDPKMMKHSNGQARVRLSGEVHYLGIDGIAEAAGRYSELVKAWKAAGKVPLKKSVTPEEVLAPPEEPLTMYDLVEQWLAYVDGRKRYWKQGKPTSHRANIKRSLDSFCNFWSKAHHSSLGSLPVTQFGSELVIQWRDSLELNQRLTRNGINRQVDPVKAVFKWGKLRGRVPREVFWDACEVARLKETVVGERPERLRERRAVTRVCLAVGAEYFPLTRRAM